MHKIKAADATGLTIPVKAGDHVAIRATGQVHTHPGGVVADADKWTDADGIADCGYVREVKELHGLPFMALIGQLGEETFLVGKSFQRTFDKSGQLVLKVNDHIPADNEGELEVTVTVTRGAAR